MPKGVYQRSEAQLEGMRERFRAQGALTKPSEEARQRMSAERTKHGHSKRSGTTPTYRCWRNMLSRCNNPRVRAYKNYGGRGITVDPRWLVFENFLADMGEQPPGLTLEREDNDGPYCKTNCVWADRSTQNRNKRPYKLSPEAIARRGPRGPYGPRKPKPQ